MFRLILLFVLIAFVTAIALALKTCTASPVTDSLDDRDFGLVALPDGATMIAAKGTVGRRLIDWLDSGDKTPRWFELGGQQFAGKSVEPTIEAKVRIPRLIAMLKAYRDVTVHVVGYTDSVGNPSANQKLSEDRAKFLVHLLEQGGISDYRLSAEGRGSSDPIGDNSTAEGRARNQRLALLLSRK